MVDIGGRFDYIMLTKETHMFCDNSIWDWLWVLYAANLLIIQPLVTALLIFLFWKLLSKRSDNQG